MRSHPRERRSKIVRHLLSAALVLSVGYTFGVSTVGGCAGASWPSHGQLPDRVVDKLRGCGRKGPTPIEPVSYDLTFMVHVTEEGEQVRVDDVMLTESTLHLPEVEACMLDALYGMRAPLEVLALRRRDLAPDSTVASEGRAVFGQAQLAWLLEAAVFIVLATATYHVVVQFARDTHRPKHRPRPAPPEVEAPPNPEPPRPEPQTAGDPKTTDPPPPPPPAPPPPPKETCDEKMPQFIRCDDPKIRWYSFWSESSAFKSIKVGGIRKEQSKAKAQRGPCVNRGGFHTKVRHGEVYIASIVGCFCCDDSSGKAVQQERATVQYH